MGEPDDIIHHRVAKIEDDQKAIRERLHAVSNTVQALALKRDADHELSQQYRQQQSEHLARQDTKLDKIEVGVQAIQTLMVGDGTDKNPGLSPRLASVERAQNGWGRFIWLVIAMSVTALGGIVMTYFKAR